MTSLSALAFHPTHLFYLVSLRCNERCSKCSLWRVRENPEGRCGLDGQPTRLKTFVR